MTAVLAIDPGNTQSAFVLFDGLRVIDRGIEPNTDLACRLRHRVGELRVLTIEAVVFEQIESFGMAVGREVFETVFETGRMFEIAGASFGWEAVTRMPRKAVKYHLCNSIKAKDTNVRQALLDRFGGSAAKGTKHAPGPLYGVHSHEWAALAIAVTWWETVRLERTT